MMNPAGIEDLGGPGAAAAARPENSTFLEHSAGLLPSLLPLPHQWRRCLRRRDGHLPSPSPSSFPLGGVI